LILRLILKSLGKLRGITSQNCSTMILFGDDNHWTFFEVESGDNVGDLVDPLSGALLRSSLLGLGTYQLVHGGE